MLSSPGRMQLPERPFQGFDLPLVVDLLPLRHFERFKDFLKVLQSVFQLFDDFRDLLDGAGDGANAGLRRLSPGTRRAGLSYFPRFRFGGR